LKELSVIVEVILFLFGVMFLDILVVMVVVVHVIHYVCSLLSVSNVY